MDEIGVDRPVRRGDLYVGTGHFPGVSDTLQEHGDSSGPGEGAEGAARQSKALARLEGILFAHCCTSLP